MSTNASPHDDHGRTWLVAQARALLDFHAAGLNPDGGIRTLDLSGTPVPTGPGGAVRAVHDMARMVHCYAIGARLNHPAAPAIVASGMDWLLGPQFDRANGGFFWSVDDNGPVDPMKQAYGHAFILLAAASAHHAGHPDAERLRERTLDALWGHFWDEDAGMARDTFAPDWTGTLAYRGQNANMHLAEALMAAHVAWGDPAFLAAAGRIARRLIDTHARDAGWVVPEHFTPDWQVDPGFDGDAMFRPSGTTPGHALEWSRLLVELWHLGGRREDWMVEAAQGLFRRAVATGWMQGGGFAYTLGADGRVSRDWRLWWPCCEAIAAAWTLNTVAPDPFWEEWYRKVWSYADARLIDHRHGGWVHEVDAEGRPLTRVFAGKPDIYHALQACLIPAGVIGPFAD